MEEDQKVNQKPPIKPKRFRIKVVLDNFFQDFRSKAYVSVDETWENVRSLEQHIRKVCKLKEDIFLLTESGILLPSTECIDLINPDDCLVAISQSSVETCVSPEAPKKKKKDKKASTTLETETIADVLPILPVILEYTPETDSPDNQKSTTDTPDTEKKSRKRRRNRKKKCADEEKDCGLEDAGEKSANGSEEVVLTGTRHIFDKPKTHIRFDGSIAEKMKALESVVSAIPVEYTQKARVIKAVQCGGGQKRLEKLNEPASISTTGVNALPEQPTNMEKTHVVDRNPQISAIETLRSNIDDMNLPVITKLPDPGEVIAFKKLCLTDDYMPMLSEYIIALVSTVDIEAKELSLIIIAGSECLKDPVGKFTLPDDNDEDETNEEHSIGAVESSLRINWRDIHQPRLVNLNGAN